MKVSVKQQDENRQMCHRVFILADSDQARGAINELNNDLVQGTNPISGGCVKCDDHAQ
jgi:hypothetical protein